MANPWVFLIQNVQSFWFTLYTIKSHTVVLLRKGMLSTCQYWPC